MLAYTLVLVQIFGITRQVKGVYPRIFHGNNRIESVPVVISTTRNVSTLLIVQQPGAQVINSSAYFIVRIRRCARTSIYIKNIVYKEKALVVFWVVSRDEVIDTIYYIL